MLQALRTKGGALAREPSFLVPRSCEKGYGDENGTNQKVHLPRSLGISGRGEERPLRTRLPLPFYAVTRDYRSNSLRRLDFKLIISLSVLYPHSTRYVACGLARIASQSRRFVLSSQWILARSAGERLLRSLVALASSRMCDSVWHYILCWSHVNGKNTKGNI